LSFSSLSILYSKQRYGHRSTSLTPITSAMLCYVMLCDDEMRFGFRLSMPKRLLQFSVTVLPGVLLALTVGTIVFTASLRYPYTLLIVSDIIGRDSALYKVCSQLESSAILVRYDIAKVLDRPNFECVSTETSPSVTVCLFDIWHDVYVSRSLHAARIWEPYLVNEFVEAVKRGGPKAGVCILFIYMY